MGKSFSDITLYASTPHKNDTPEYWEDVFLKNYVSDLYVQKMYGYKPPKTTRITIEPSFHNIWNRTWKNGSLVSIAPFYSYDEYCSFDKKGKYKYILDIIQTATLQLSDEYNWDKTVFERAYNEVIDCDFIYKVEYPIKTSKDKKKTGQVVIEKTETKTTLFLIVTNGKDVHRVKLFENKNWFWYDVAYEIAKNSKWIDNNSFGVFSKKTDKYGYYSLIDNVVIGKLDFKGNEFLI